MQITIETKEVTQHRGALLKCLNYIKSNYGTTEGNTVRIADLVPSKHTERKPFILYIKPSSNVIRVDHVYFMHIFLKIEIWLQEYYKNNQKNAQKRIIANRISANRISVSEKEYIIGSSSPYIIEFTMSYGKGNVEPGLLSNQKRTKVSKVFNPESDTSIAEKLLRLKKSAESRGIPFDISFKRLKQLSKITRCQITGEELTFEADKPNSRSIDRIDNDRGYIDDNVCVTSVKFNKAKDNLTLEQIKLLYEFIKRKKLI